MRHDAERPQTTRLITEAPVPGHWIQVLSTMRENPFTRLSLDEVRAAAAHILIVSPSAEVALTCFGQLLHLAGEEDFIKIVSPEEIVAENVPAGTWIFLPHRDDGWTELESASAQVRARLVKENSTRARDQKLTFIEYGVNLWLWAEPPSTGGDPVCHAGELISWESAWTLGDQGSAHLTHPLSGASARPPIYFGLPEVLRRRRWDG